MKTNMYFVVGKVCKKQNHILKKELILHILLIPCYIVCGDDEILVGDACVYNSKSIGDIQSKPECESYKNSFDQNPFILPDAAVLYSKAAYLSELKV